MDNTLEIRVMGLSAYEDAVRHGFDGTFAEWIETLKEKVVGITKTTSGNTNTYTMTFANGTAQTFTVDNGKEISSITKRSSTATDSTLLITFNDGTTETVTIPNGTGISSVVKVGDTVNLVDTYQINFTDKDPVTFTVTNGRSIISIAKTNTNGIVDTYTITYNDNTTSTFQLRNSIDTVSHDYTSELDGGRVYVMAKPIGETERIYLETNDYDRPDSATYSSIKIPVNGGQMFRITAEGSAVRPVYSVLNSENVVAQKSTEAKYTNHLIQIEQDGFLLLNTKTANTDNSIRRVTLFDEVNNAIASIPDTDELVSAVIEALPLAEEGEF